MNTLFVASGLITVIFSILSFVESKYISKTNKDIKESVRETLMVFVSVLAGSFILDKFKLGKVAMSSENKQTAVFVDKPEF